MNWIIENGCLYESFVVSFRDDLFGNKNRYAVGAYRFAVALSAGCADALQYGTVLFSFYRLFCGLLVVASVYDDPYRLRRAFFPVLLL